MHDIKAAIRYLRGNATQLGLDPRRFVILGSSAVSVREVALWTGGGKSARLGPVL
jgi:carboxylesterase type B